MSSQPLQDGAELKKIAGQKKSREDVFEEGKRRFIEQLSKGRSAIFPTEFIDGRETANILIKARKLQKKQRETTC